jgi:hypothetical protein
MFLSNIVVAKDPVNNDANAFFVNISTGAGADFDARIGARGGNTNLFLCAGDETPNKAQISAGAGDFTLLKGRFITTDVTLCSYIGGVSLKSSVVTCSALTTTTSTLSSFIGGVGLQNSYVTSRLNISLISGSTLTLTAPTQATTFLLTTDTSELVLPGANASMGMYWAIKNVSSGSMNITPSVGSILNMTSPFTMISNALLTIVYTGTPSNYYAL